MNDVTAQDWVAFAIFVLVGFLVGAMMASLVRRAIDREGRAEQVRNVAGQISRLVVLDRCRRRPARRRSIRQPASGRPPPVVERMVESTIFGLFAIMALAQLGIDNTLIYIIAACVFGGVMLSAALLTGLGGQDVASQIAAGRGAQEPAGGR